MPRRGKVKRRVIPPDAKYNSSMVAKFINMCMLRGQKATAEKIVYSALDIIQRQLNKNPVEVLEQAIKNATPLLEVKARRVAGATYQVPVEVPPERGISKAMKWIIHSARERKGKPMAERLASEIIDAYNGQGASIKKKEDLHKMAEANRAFVHYRW